MTGKPSADLLAAKLRVGVLTPDENTLASDMLRRVPELEEELHEQARLNGMGAERELALMAKVEKLRANAARWEWIADGNNFDESFALLTDPAITSDLLTREVDAAIANARKDTQ